LTNCYAMVLVSPGKIIKKTFRIPKVKENELLLKVEMVSICGSDRHLYEGTHKAASFPKILGHEVVGFVDQIGEKASEEYHLKIGDRVTVEPYIMCKNCEFCLTGLTCDQYPFLLGGYSEYMHILPGSKLHKINKDVPSESACLSSVIGNGVRWIRTKAQVSLGEAVVIIGAGAQGLASVIIAKESGAKPIIVLGINKDFNKFKIAKEFGADYLINIEENDPVKEVEKITNGRMAEVVIECAGVDSSVKTAFLLARPGGRVILAGLTGGKNVSVCTDRIVNNELIVKGGHGQSWDVEDAVKIINSKKYAIEKMITHKFPLTEVQKAMELFLIAPPECTRVALIP